MHNQQFLIPWMLICGAFFAPANAAEPRGYQPNVAVTGETRIDWVFAVANQSPAKPPPDWLRGYDSTKQRYELYVPEKYDAAKPQPLVLFISPSDKGSGWNAWQAVCKQQGAFFVGPHGAGNNCETRQRIRIVLDALDDVRRRFNIDPDRTYIGGFSGGGRIACAIGFSLPEQFGGVFPICAAGDLRSESWLRQRAIDRLSVAHITGETDFNRGEVERFRAPMLADVGVRSRVWMVSGMGHAVPNAARLTEVWQWLEEAAPARKKFADQFPASRVSEKSPSREEASQQLFDEAKQRMTNRAALYSGLMQMKGIHTRWPDTAAGQQATKVLTQLDDAPQRPWEAEDVAEQRRFLIARAKGLDAYATGPIHKQYAAQRKDMAEGAIELWKMVIADGQDEAAVTLAKQRLPVLQKLLTE